MRSNASPASSSSSSALLRVLLSLEMDPAYSDKKAIQGHTKLQEITSVLLQSKNKVWK